MKVPIESLNAWLAHPVRRVFALAGVSFALVGALGLTGYLQDVELLLVDARFKTRERFADVAIDSSVVTIDWDEQAIQRGGRWPWTWDRHARLIRFLDRWDARQAAIVDDHFSAPVQVTMPLMNAAQLEDGLRIRAAKGDHEGVMAMLPRHEEIFVDAIRTLGRVSLCGEFVIPEAEEKGMTAVAEVVDVAKLADVAGLGTGADGRPPPIALPDTLLRFSGGLPSPGRTLRAFDFKPPLPRISEAVAGLGFNRIIQDVDGVVRHLPAVVEYGGRAWPTLAVAMAARHFGVPQDKIIYRPGRNIEFPGAKFPNGDPARVPIDGRGLMAVNWLGEYQDHAIHYPYMMVAEHIALADAKEFFPLLDPGSLDLDALTEAAHQAVAAVRLLGEEEARRVSFALADGIIAERCQQNGIPWESYYAEWLQGSDTGGLGRLRWDAVAINNLAAQMLDAGETPVYSELLAQAGAADTVDLRANFDQVLYQHRKGLLEMSRPLLFMATPLTLADGTALNWSPLLLRDRTVFIGLTATALNALNPTPFDKRYQMLGLQPNAFNTIVTGAYLREWPAWSAYLFAALYALAVTFWILRLETANQILASGALLVAHVGGAWLGFARGAIVAPILLPSLSIVVAHSGAVLFRYLEEQRERKRVRGLFSAMVSPQVLAIMEERPDKFNLAGEKVDATMFSSDVSGFTTISEGVTAQGLANILNIYLTPMSNIVMKYDGFVDKYEGDAIKAEFGVPLEDADHPWKGVCSALEQQEELTAIARMLLLKYGVKITARMGVNTGIVSAGNMGSEKRMQYTVMGEEVSLAEELEPINKLYESWVAIGPDTEKRSRHIIESRLLDVVRMGPRHNPTSVFEPLGWKRDIYLAYWKDRPVPPLFLEGWRKMTAERVLGYDYYFRRKNLPDGPMKREIEALIFGLAPHALATMKALDVAEMLDFRDALAVLAELVERQRGAADGMPEPDYLVRERSVLEAKRAKLTEPWEQLIWDWRILLKNYQIVAEQIAGKASTAEIEEILKQVDAIEKRTESYFKRCSFPTEADEVGWSLAQNLKEILPRTDAEFMSQNRDVALAKANEMQKKITETVEKFLGTLAAPERARLYHEYMADFCPVSEVKLKVREIFDRARALYLKREWDAAIAGFNEALAIDASDGPSLMYIKRCEKLKKDPPPEDWDTYWTEE
jgi:class 3 adenylate cyclase/CHASE2 domain-containing sensor protein